jgi:hypothetical protein
VRSIKRQTSTRLARYGREEGPRPVSFRLLEGTGCVERPSQLLNALHKENATHRLQLLLASAREQFIPSYLQRLLSRQWFTPRWILQEIALAQDATIHCGHSKIPWKWFEAGVNILAEELGGENCGAFRSDFGNFHAASNVTGLHSRPTGLHTLIWGFHLSECVDPSDRLFFLYGIAELSRLVSPSPWHPLVAGVTSTIMSNPPPRSIAPPRIDYDRLWCDVYVDMAQYLHNEDFQEFWSHLLAFQPLSTFHPTYPSWVPNWASKRDHNRTFSFSKVLVLLLKWDKGQDCSYNATYSNLSQNPLL